MLKLLIDSAIQGATIPVDWCISRDLFEALQGPQKCVRNPQVLIVVTPHGRSSDRVQRRYLVPLENLREYVVLSRPGVNDIFATVVWEREGRVGRLHDRYLAKSSGLYKTDVITFDGTRLLEEHLDDGRFGHLGSTKVEVIVPESVFARPLPRWLSWWVDLGFEEKRHEDECHTRKRMLYAFLLKPLLVALWILFITTVRLIYAVVLLSLLVRRIDFAPIIHPFRNWTRDIVIDTDDQDFGFQWFRGGKMIFAFLGFTPVIPGLLSFCLYLYATSQHYRHPFLWMFKIDAIVLGVITGALLLVNLWTFLVEPSLMVAFDEKERRRKATAREVQLDLQEALVCDSPEFTTRFATLPVRQRVHLFYWNAKRAVCKPYPR